MSDGRSYTYAWSDRGELLAETTQGVDLRTFEWDAAGRLVAGGWKPPASRGKPLAGLKQPAGLGSPSPAVHRRAGLAAAVVDGTGQVLGSGVETLAAAINTQERPALSYDTNGGRYLAVWADYRNSAEDPDVYGQLYRDYTPVIEYAGDPLSRLDTQQLAPPPQ